MELNINIDEYLKRFKIYYPKSLFPPDFNQLKNNKCPICFHKLYWNKDKSKAFCKSKRNDRFFITRETFDRITA